MHVEHLLSYACSCRRRRFLQLAAVAAASAYSGAFADEPGRTVPHRPLGSSGLMVPMLGVGAATAGRDLDGHAAAEFFHAALDAGAGYFDTATAAMGYGRAADWLAPVLRERRGEAFVVTKVFADDGERALRLLAENLRELDIDRADLVLVHSVGDARIDPATLLGRRGALGRAKAEGLARAIGVSAHDRPGKVRGIIGRADGLDAVMVPINPVDWFAYGFEGEIGPSAARRGIGLIGFKILGGPGGTASEHVPGAFRYAWSQPGLATAVVGFRDRAELAAAVALARGFRPPSGAERAALLADGRGRAAGTMPAYGPRVGGGFLL